MNRLNSFQAFCAITDRCDSTAPVISNFAWLQLPEDAPCIRVLWMYPDILSLHGGRGDLMALLRFATAAGLPLTIRKVLQPGDPLPLQEADLLYFCAGDLQSMPDLIRALRPQQHRLIRFAKDGGLIVANGSSGAILAERLTFTDGTGIEGLGLLGMSWTQRPTVLGDDLWLRLPDGTELTGTQISLADVVLNVTQPPLAQVLYGYGNCGTGSEGAAGKHVFYSACLGPVLVRNPPLAQRLLSLAGSHAGLLPEGTLPDLGDISSELVAHHSAVEFIRRKLPH